MRNENCGYFPFHFVHMLLRSCLRSISKFPKRGGWGVRDTVRLLKKIGKIVHKCVMICVTSFVLRTHKRSDDMMI